MNKRQRKKREGKLASIPAFRKFNSVEELVAHCFPDMLEEFLHCQKDCPHGLGKWLAEDIFENTNLGENK